MNSKTLLLRCALFSAALFFLSFFGFGQSTNLSLTMQDAFFPTQFNSGGDFYNSGSSELGMWANADNSAKQTVAWRDLNTASNNSGSARSLQIGDEFSITVRCTRAFGQIGFSLNASGIQGGSYANNVSGSKLRINTDNYGSWYISNGSTSTSFNYNPSENTYRDYKFVVKILSPTLVTVSLFVDNSFYSSIQNFSLLNTNPITSFSVYGSDMWDGSSNDDAFWKNCAVTSSTTVELGYALTSGNITPGLITNGLAANSTSTSSVNTVFVGGDSGTSVIFNQPCTYTGLTNVNLNATLQLNNSGGGTLPSTNSINVNGTLRISTNQTLADLTINTGGTVVVDANAQLTINGILSNSGTFTLESGATLVQGASSTLSGNGIYNVKQTITGTGTTTPTGRFWYLGSPVASASSAVLLSNANNILKRRNEQTSQWETVSTGNLEVGKGYYLQASNGSASAGNITLTITGGSLNNSPTASAMTISGLSRTAGQGFEGFNLVANPYPSYLDWDAVTKTDVGNTMWYRTFNSTNNTMVFDTYVAGTNGIGTNLNGAGVSNLIPPMQSFWVRVNANANPSLNNTGSLGLSNSMRAHFTSINGSTAGLKSTSNERDLFLRMNLLQADKKDQLIVYVNETATNGFDVLDGEKMMQAGMPQFYTSAAGKKITINGLNSAKKQQALPITLELPTTGVHSFVIEDLEIDNGLVWLEDKQEEIMQALEPGTIYEFYANSGINAERFVLHFQLIDDATLVNVYNEVNSAANFSGKGASVHAEAAGVVVIKLPATTEGVTDIQIRDAAGRLVYSGSTNTLETSVQLEQANGIYYVTLNSTSGVEVRKVFVQQ